MEEYKNGGEVKIENLLLMADIQLEELISTGRLLEILSPPTIYDKVVRFAESRKKEIVRAGAMFALLTILTQTPIAGSAKSSYEEGLKKTAEISQEVDGIIYNLEPLIAGIDFSKPNVEQIVAVFENSPMRLDKNLVPQLEFKIQNIIDTSERNTEGLSEKLISAYAEVSLYGLNFGANDSATFAGMYDGIAATQNLAQNQIEPIAVNNTIFETEIVNTEHINGVYLIETSGESKVIGEGEKFNFNDEEHTVIREQTLKNSNNIQNADLLNLGINILERVNTLNSSIFIIGNNVSGYKIITTQSDSNNQNIENTTTTEDSTTLILDAKPLVFKSEPMSEQNIENFVKIRITLNEREYSRIEFNANIEKIDITTYAFQESSEPGGKTYQSVIQEGTGSNSDSINFIRQSGLGICSIASPVTAIGDLLGVPLNFNDLINYNAAFIGGDAPYERTFGEMDVLRFMPETHRAAYLEILDRLAKAIIEFKEAKETYALLNNLENIDTIQNAQLKLDEAEIKIKLIENERDKFVEDNVPDTSIIKGQGIIRNITAIDTVTSLDALGVDSTNVQFIEGFKEIIPGKDGETFGKGKVEAIPEAIIQNVEKLATSFLTKLQENTNENSVVVLDMHVNSQNDSPSLHRVTVIGVNVEEGYLLIKDTNGTGLWGENNYYHTGSNSFNPTIEIIGDEGVFKFSFKIDPSDIESQEKVARTLISFYNFTVFSKIK